ncbi:MAG: hypothetical protein QG549_557 [Patescibacteria group bacterium]|nr:hypothetical protein [Patescibacteria group bacterium]
MPTQPDAIDIEQLRAQLEAMYAPSGSTADVVERAPTYQPQRMIDTARLGFIKPGVTALTREAKSHSPDHNALKAQHIATLGTYIDSLRIRKLRGQ